MSNLRIECSGGLTRVTLARPDVRNAFNDELIGELAAAFRALPVGTRVVVLGGDGQAFCAGADLAWMQRSVAYDEARNTREARELGAMFRAVDEAPCVVVARVQGAALGGGAGLVACCDVVVAEQGARFGFTEVRLGLVPAVISPFVLRRLGPARARRWFVTGELFGADEARRIGLADEVAPAAQLDAVIDGIVKAVLRAGPRAVDAAKLLVREVEAADPEAVHERTAALIASLRVGAEGQEGLRAFLEKREPRWP